MPKMNTHTARILVIDDNKEYCRLLAKYFSHYGHRVRTALNGRKGIAKAKKTVPDLIIVDMALPDMKGADVIAELRADTAACATPVILITADSAAAPGSRSAELAGNCRLVVQKPVELDDLLSWLEENIKPERN